MPLNPAGRTCATALTIFISFAFLSASQPKPSRKAAALKRAKLHRILDTAKSPDGDVHMAFGELGIYGDKSSIPHLITALRLFPDQEIEGRNVGMICTQAHCVQDLEQLTGAKVGVSYSSWKAWWEKTHPGQPLIIPRKK